MLVSVIFFSPGNWQNPLQRMSEIVVSPVFYSTFIMVTPLSVLTDLRVHPSSLGISQCLYSAVISILIAKNLLSIFAVVLCSLFKYSNCISMVPFNKSISIKTLEIGHCWCLSWITCLQILSGCAGIEVLEYALILGHKT